MAYTTTSFMPLKMPTPGSREPAQISLINENMVVVSGHDHANGKGVPVATVRSGLAANRPAPSAAGGIYFATDTGIVSLDNGSTWTDFLTSGGSATVTGWTLIDPIIRDTLLFGPEPTGTADTTIARVSANALQFSGNVGVGMAPDSRTGADYKLVQVGGASIMGVPTDMTSINIFSNSVFDGTNFLALSNAPTTRLIGGIGGLTVQTAPAVAAGAAQTFTTRLTVDQAGQVGIGTSNAMVAWTSPYKNIQMGLGGAVYAHDGYPQIGLAANLYYDASSQPRYTSNGLGCRMLLGQDGTLYFDTAPNGTAGALATLSQRLKVDGNGTVTLTPAAGQLALVVSGSIVPGSDLPANTTIGSPTNRFSTAYVTSISAGPGANLFLGAGATYVLPNNDNGHYCGHPSFRWTAVYAVNPTIQTSHVSLKEGFAPLDPAACAQAVLDTDWLSFNYKPTGDDPGRPEPITAPDGETPEATAEREERDATNLRVYEEGKVGAEMARQQKGYVLGSDEYHTADLFGQSDRYSASTHADLAVVACALQDALRRLAALEANNATA